MEDPSFVSDLAAKRRAKLPPVARAGAQLMRKRSSNFVRQGFRGSLLFHGAVLVIFLVNALFHYFIGDDAKQKALVMNQKTAIRVDLVDLPSLKLTDLAQVDPTEQIGSEKPSENTPPPQSRMKTPSNKSEVNPQDRLKEIRDKLRNEARRQDLMAKLKINPKEHGRAALAGNQLSQGYSTTGDIATDADAYNGQIKAHLQKHWSVPTWMVASKLRAKIVVKIAPDGRILGREFTRRSGNSEFDAAVENTVENSNPFPAPPRNLARMYEEDGIEWGFPN